MTDLTRDEKIEAEDLCDDCPPPGHALVKLDDPARVERVARLLVGTAEGGNGISAERWERISVSSKTIYRNKAKAVIKTFMEAGDE